MFCIFTFSVRAIQIVGGVTVNKTVQTARMKSDVPLFRLRAHLISFNAQMVRVYYNRGAVMVWQTAVISRMSWIAQQVSVCARLLNV